MRRKPIEYNNEFITETVVLLNSETRTEQSILALNVYELAHAGLSNQKVRSRHDINEVKNFPLRKILKAKKLFK